MKDERGLANGEWKMMSESQPGDARIRLVTHFHPSSFILI
jgi:hypothetical protein